MADNELNSTTAIRITGESWGYGSASDILDMKVSKAEGDRHLVFHSSKYSISPELLEPDLACTDFLQK